MKKIKMYSWNVNGLRAVYKKGFLDWFTKERPYILCIQETKAAQEQLPSDLKNIQGYHTYYRSAERKGYSGVALFTKAEPATISAGFGINRFDSEGRIQMADYKSFVLFNIYFPNGKASMERLRFKMEFYDAFLYFADKLKRKGKRLVICGDVNTAHKEIDLARPKENEKISGFLPQERAWIDKLVNHGYVDTFRMFNHKPGQYTWWDLKTKARERNVGWRIDYFFVSDNFRKNVKRSYILPEVMGSDHCPIGIDITVPG
jgi:exodeoxyribonuclease-3